MKRIIINDPKRGPHMFVQRGPLEMLAPMCVVVFAAASWEYYGGDMNFLVGAFMGAVVTGLMCAILDTFAINRIVTIPKIQTNTTSEHLLVIWVADFLGIAREEKKVKEETQND